MKAGKKNCSPWLQLIKSIVAGDSYTILGLYCVTFRKYLKDHQGKLVIIIGFHWCHYHSSMVSLFSI